MKNRAIKCLVLLSLLVFSLSCGSLTEPQDTTSIEFLSAPGAAAAIAAAKQIGSERGLLLAHTSSNEVMLRKMGTTSADSVGYAAIVF